mmetsp:Transcript_20747/g.23071  ORF Transcript_20747/g.23071 Transcript_20747/m.23071 type:complete len:360 (-) Transcript_20747:219-1298(-)|eukprot:CAMPEP_0168517452 /NCGR_PEP_ID=MMETSP0405-20121227/6046_1 /TAXON_ID=498012 /ORGANISM="Trichosphaerium sp, Strain Am-I-7 wt" /LENGTH=359 /DNA_ID=CAMNT_0008537437 /DNA_START=51 /DNA_END=1130 /DNA_ORIENTATION=-
MATATLSLTLLDAQTRDKRVIVVPRGSFDDLESLKKTLGVRNAKLFAYVDGVKFDMLENDVPDVYTGQIKRFIAVPKRVRASTMRSSSKSPRRKRGKREFRTTGSSDDSNVTSRRRTLSGRPRSSKQTARRRRLNRIAEAEDAARGSSIKKRAKSVKEPGRANSTNDIPSRATHSETDIQPQLYNELYPEVYKGKPITASTLEISPEELMLKTSRTETGLMTLDRENSPSRNLKKMKSRRSLSDFSGSRPGQLNTPFVEMTMEPTKREKSEGIPTPELGPLIDKAKQDKYEAKYHAKQLKTLYKTQKKIAKQRMKAAKYERDMLMLESAVGTSDTVHANVKNVNKGAKRTFMKAHGLQM